MDRETVIEVHDLKKKFKVYRDKGNTLKEKVLFWNRNRYETRWVLNGISFQVRKGEAVGLIGPNGCGKSTTLKLLNRIIYPNGGTVKISGRVSSLIELGAGFHPDMSGRENIYTNASIFGLDKKSIDERIDDIIAFSELEEFMDNPVRTYSSGMYMRLAFAVAINVDADILLIDEILAVGDANFQSKCFNKLREIKKRGTTIVIVSHSLEQIEKICDRTIWLQDGEIREDGKPQKVHVSYTNFMMGKAEEREKREQNRTKKSENGKEISKAAPKFIEIGNKKVEFTSVRLFDAKTEEEKDEFEIGDSIIAELQYVRNDEDIKSAEIGAWIVRKEDDLCCIGMNTQADEVEEFILENKGIICVQIDHLPLSVGRYAWTFTLRDNANEIYHRIFQVGSFLIKSDRKDFGVAVAEHEWFYNGKIAEKAVVEHSEDVTDFWVNIEADMTTLEVTSGESVPGIVHITNLSDVVLEGSRFNPLNVSYHLYNDRGELLHFEGKRFPVKDAIVPGCTSDINVFIDTDGLAEGEYLAEITLVKESVIWAGALDGDMTARVELRIVEG